MLPVQDRDIPSGANIRYYDGIHIPLLHNWKSHNANIHILLRSLPSPHKSCAHFLHPEEGVVSIHRFRPDLLPLLVISSLYFFSIPRIKRGSLFHDQAVCRNMLRRKVCHLTKRPLPALYTLPWDRRDQIHIQIEKPFLPQKPVRIQEILHMCGSVQAFSTPCFPLTADRYSPG